MSTAYTLRPWSEVVEPHEDVRSGDLSMGTYAANLAAVAAGEHRGARVYSDPAEFFASTYFTEAMLAILGDVWGSLAGERGDRVLQLRTPFGGGKTHALLALYHLAAHPKEAFAVPELSGLPKVDSVRTAVLSGEYLDPQRGREVEGRRIRTLWGELAYQLGGWDAYDEIAEGDDEGTPPGGEWLGRLLDGDPALILLDETLIYVAKGRAIPRHDSDMGKQSLMFIQNLSEAVNQTNQAAMVYSLQASVGEAVEEEGLLHALEHVAARIDTRREPVTGDEVLRVVQRRLFDSLGEDAVREEVAAQFAESYRAELEANADTEAERRAAKSAAETLRKRILLSYPFHPELIDLMYHRWGSLPTYQRTRGALRFLATVIHALWESDGPGRAGALIGPGDVDLADEGTRGAFFEQVGEERSYRAVVEADFLVADAGAKAVDERLGRDAPALARLRIGTRVATAIMLMSFGAKQGEDRGALEHEVIDAALIPELDGNLIRGALRELRGEALLYLHHTGRRYRFEPRPNLNKLIIAEQEKLESDEVLDHVRQSLERDLAASEGTGGVVVWPTEPKQIPDGVPVFQIAYLHPDWSEARVPPDEFVLANQRRFKNGIGLALPKHQALDRARRAARTVLAVEQLLAEKTRHQFNDEQVEELRERQSRATSDLGHAIAEAYERVLLPIEVSDGRVEFDEIDLSTVLAAGRGLHARVREALSTKIFPSLTASKLKSESKVAERGSVRCEQLVEQLFTFLGLPRLWSAEPVRAAISDGVEKGLFGYCVEVEGEGSDVRVTDASLVRFQTALPPEEVDLGSGAAILAPEVAGRLRPTETGTDGGGEAEDETDAEGDEGGGEGARTIGLTIEATKGVKLQTLNVVLSHLRDLVGPGGTLKISLDVAADTGGEPIDEVVLQNMVLQHLDEDQEVEFKRRPS